jgi:uncharacterized protein (TIGR02145 family)
MAVQITSLNYSGQTGEVTLYLPTGSTVTYTSATTINLGVKTMPFQYEASDITWEYGVFSIYFSATTKTCTVSEITPPDGSGNTYKTIKIGNQIWMSENLKTTKFQDGTFLNSSFVSNATWAAASGSTTQYWTLVNTSSNNTAIYGLLYNEFAITGSTIGSTASTNLCPSGWHIPTNDEFATLNTFLDANTTTQLKLKSTTVWTSINGTNSSGFNGVPAGFRSSSGGFNSFNQVAYFWTTNFNTYWRLANFNTTFTNGTFDSRYGLSVRCLKD